MDAEAREAVETVKDLDKYVYKFQPLTQTFHREPSKASQLEMFKRKEAERREHLTKTIPSWNDSVVLRGAPRTMSSFYKSWVGIDNDGGVASPGGAAHELDDSSDEEDSNLTITHIPKIDQENPLSIQFERMGQTMKEIDVGMERTNKGKTT